MIISLITRVKKLTENEVVLNLPEPEDTECTWIWRHKSFRLDDILDITLFNTKQCSVNIFDRETGKPKKILVKEPYEELYEKWMSAEAEGIVFDPDFEEENEEEAKNREEDE